MNRTALIRKIQVARRQTPGMDDDVAYRAFLVDSTAGNKNSLREMTDRELVEVIDHFKTLGWQPKASKHQYKKNNDSQIRMIYGLWSELHELGAVRDGSREALRKWVNRMTGVERIEWLFSTTDVNKVIESLKAWRDRAEEELES